MAFNPFDGYPSDRLYEAALSLALTCGRAKSPTHNPRKQLVCELFALAKNELTHRGEPVPVAPYYSGKPPKKLTPWPPAA